ncbi:peptide deformylase, mitochondrial-like [Lepeophtheirus salmonis]|uniref:peptide deformylase, mitochondrial-like n=1 Tax=Lepeophtheirus salmonis TaxID=72036 RepID=UPI003AF3D875
MRTTLYRCIHKPSKSWLELFDKRMQRAAKEMHQTLPPYEHVVQIGDPILRGKVEEIPLSEIKTPFINSIADKLLHVLKKYDAVGVSAPQIGTPIAMFAVGFTKSQIKSWSTETVAKEGMEPIDPPRVVINPRIDIIDSSSSTHREGCCSLYGFSAQVTRYRKVLLKGYNIHGEAFEWLATDWTARIIQHEMDHLSGKLFIDPPTSTQTLEFNYWQSVNNRKGNFKMSYSGVGASHKLFPFKIFFRQS